MLQFINYLNILYGTIHKLICQTNPHIDNNVIYFSENN
jgi:hypothetical protein